MGKIVTRIAGRGFRKIKKMKRIVLYFLFALLLVNCGQQPQTLSELKYEYVTVDDSIRVYAEQRS